MNAVMKLPFDPARIVKGERFTVAEIEAMTHCNCESPEFLIHLMRLRRQIEQYSERVGSPVTVKTEKRELLILSDRETGLYTRKKNRRGVRLISRAFIQTTQIDTRNLTAPEKDEHLREWTNQATTVQALARAKANVPRIAYQRSLPLSTTL